MLSYSTIALLCIFQFQVFWSLLRIISYNLKFILSYAFVLQIKSYFWFWLFYRIWRSKFWTTKFISISIELYNTFLHCVGINEGIGASVVTNNCFHLCHMLRAETIESVTNGIDTKINYGKEHMSLRMKNL